MSKTLVAGLFVALILTQGCLEAEPIMPPENPPEQTTVPEAPADRAVVVHLFEWKWTDIAREYAALSDPQLHHRARRDVPVPELTRPGQSGTSQAHR